MSNHTKFRVLRKGYDRFEVDSYVTQLETKIASLNQQNLKQEELLIQTKTDLDDAHQKYKHLHSEIGAREKAVESMSRLALREANDIIDTAYNNADIIVREAMSSARQLLVEISRISNESHHLKDDLNIKLGELYLVIQDLELPKSPNIKIPDIDQDK